MARITVNAPVATDAGIIPSAPDVLTAADVATNELVDAKAAEVQTQLEVQPGRDHPVLQQDMRVKEAKRVRQEGKGALERSAGVIADNVGLGVKAIGQQASIRISAATTEAAERIESGEGSTSVVTGALLAASGFTGILNDPDWNPREDSIQAGQILSDLSDRGISPDSKAGKAMFASTSGVLYQLNLAHIDEERERAGAMKDAGVGGVALGLAASMIDGDILLPVFKVQKAFSATKLDRLLTTGALTTNEAAAVATVTHRVDNVLDLAVNAGVSTGVIEAAIALGSPTHDIQDVLGATIAGTALGAGIGAVLPTVNAHRVAGDIATNRVHTAAFNEVKAAEAAETARLKSSLDQVKRAEGPGTTTTPGDRGGETTMGISSKYFPKEHAELKKLLSTDARAAELYRQKFFTTEFYDKVVTPGMTTDQAKVLTDAAVLHGVGTAKKLWTKAKGNLNKFLDLRDKLVDDIVDADPSQGKFLDGWKNRTAALREDINNVYGSKRDPNFIAELTPDPEGSVGATSLTGSEILETTGEAVELEKAHTFLDAHPETGVLVDLEDIVDAGSSGAQRIVQQAAQHMYAGIRKTPFISDFDRIVKDGGVIGQMLAGKGLLESPVGQFINNKGASAVQIDIQHQAGSMYAPNKHALYSAWAKDQNINPMSARGVLYGQVEFGKEVQKYRAHIGRGTTDPNTHPSIIAASEDLDNTFKFLLDRNKHHGTDGFEDVEWLDGYSPTKWDGTKSAVFENMVGTERLVQSLKRGIMAKTPDMDENLAFIYASAVHSHLKDQSLGSPVGSLMTVSNDGKATLERAITAGNLHEGTGLTPAELVDRVMFNTDRGTAKTSRRKINIDLLEPIEGSDGATLLDLLDNNLYATVDRTVRAQSKIAALSSQDIQLRDFDDMARAAATQATAEGRDISKSVLAIRDTESFWGEGAFRGGAGPIVGRLNKLAVLQFLPQLGVTQTAEAGVAMGVAGVRAYSHYMGKSLPNVLKGMDNDLLNSMHGIKDWRGDHTLFAGLDQLDDINFQTASPFLKTMDAAMDNGMKALGHVSLFYKVNHMLQSVAALSMQDYMIKNIVKGKQSRRLASMGVDDEYRKLILAKVDDGSISFSPEGYLENIKVESWTPDEAFLLRSITRRNIDQTVQKSRPGQAHAWQYDGIGALLSSLRTFTFTAAQMQLIRTARLADVESLGMLLATTATAGLAVTAKLLINGRTDELDLEHIGVGALQWSALLSPALMGVDALSYVTGMDHIGSPFPASSGYGRYGASGLLSLPPGLSAANNTLNLGRVPLDLLSDGEMSSEAISALRSIPIVGRSYPSALIQQLPGLLGAEPE